MNNDELVGARFGIMDIQSHAPDSFIPSYGTHTHTHQLSKKSRNPRRCPSHLNADRLQGYAGAALDDKLGMLYALLGAITCQKFVMKYRNYAYGGGANGKSTSRNTIAKLIRVQKRGPGTFT